MRVWLYYILNIYIYVYIYICDYICVFPDRLENCFHKAGNCSSKNLLLCSWPARLVFSSDAKCIINWLPPGTMSKTVVVSHQASASKGLSLLGNRISRAHQAPVDLRWPLVRSYLNGWSSWLGKFWESLAHRQLPFRTETSLHVRRGQLDPRCVEHHEELHQADVHRRTHLFGLLVQECKNILPGLSEMKLKQVLSSDLPPFG